MRAIVVGGSIGGLFAANILERSGWEVVVVERTRDRLSARGAGVVTHPELFAALARAGIAQENLGVVDVKRRITFGMDGTDQHVLDLPQGLVAWGELHRRLEGALGTTRIIRGVSAASFEDSAQEVVVYLSDGQSLRGDVLIGADGFRSTVRRLLLPDEQLGYAGYAAWRGLVSEDDLDPGLSAGVMTCFSFGFPRGEQIVGYPVAKPAETPDDAPRQFNYVWYRPAADVDELEAMLTDASGTIHRDGIPPALLRVEVLAQMRADALRVLSPPLAAAVRATPLPLLQPIYDFAATRFATGRVALVGDAAVVARPHCGMGVTKAGSDAAALAEALALNPSDVPAALREYDAKRRPIGHALMHHAQELGCTIGSDKPPATAQLAQRLMQEIAVAPDIAVAS